MESSSIFLVFHISLLKSFKGEIESCPLPDQEIDAHPISVTGSIVAGLSSDQNEG